MNAVTVASVDCSANRALCDSQDIHNFPHMRIYNAGKEKSKYELVVHVYKYHIDS